MALREDDCHGFSSSIFGGANKDMDRNLPVGYSTEHISKLNHSNTSFCQAVVTWSVMENVKENEISIGCYWSARHPQHRQGDKTVTYRMKCPRKTAA